MSVAHLYSTYIETSKTSEQIFDKLIVTLALAVSEHALATGGDVLTEDLLELIHTTTNDSLYYKVIGPDGAFIMGYDAIPEPLGGIQVLEQHLRFYDAEYLDQAVRVVAVSSLVEGRDLDGWMTTFVAQTLNDREEYVYSALLDASLRVLFLIIVVSILLYAGVSFGLKPLNTLQASVMSRHPNDLSPVAYENPPPELAGLVTALNDLLGRLSENISMTKRFVENAAHQLRTPVSALLPQAELALRHAESDRERVAVGKIRASAGKIARLTHQLLNLTTAETIAQGGDDFQAINLEQVARQHISTYLELNPQDPLTLDLQSAPLKGIELSIDEVLDNLLDNARKYGGDSHAILVRTFRRDSASILEVIDQGDGIPEAERVKVTERFYRLAPDNNGSGLGLAIVKEIVEAHHGSLEIDSGPDGVGTCVRCSFPAA
jgi:two-component system sensor histidine kinase TctE